MTYRHKKSGVTFTTSCACVGENWEEVKAQTPKAIGGKTRESAADAEASDSGRENWDETANPSTKAPAPKAKSGKKREPAADAQPPDAGEDS